MDELIDRNRQVCLWLSVSGVLSLLIGAGFQFLPLPEELSTERYWVFYLISISCIIPAIVFNLMKPSFTMSDEEDRNSGYHYYSKLSRNAFLFVMILAVVVFVVYNSTASLISRFFFILAGLSFVLACVTHIIALIKYKKHE